MQATTTCSGGSENNNRHLRKATSDTSSSSVVGMADMVENLSTFSFTVSTPVATAVAEEEEEEEEEEEGDQEESSPEILWKCECCGLAEECTAAYIEKTKEIFCGRFVCGLCSEAVKEERRRLGSVESDAAAAAAGVEEALLNHMKVCIKFNTSTRADPAAHLATAMRQILRRSVEEQLGVTPKPRGRLWQRSGLSRSETFSARGQRKSLQ